MEPTETADRRALHLATRQRPLTTEEYHRIGEAGILREDDRVELLDGRLIAMSPIGPAHLHCVNRLTKLLSRRIYADRDPVPWISIQNPIRLSDVSEPEPDVVLLSADAPQDRTPGPGDVPLVVEVADSSADYDRHVKVEAYAEAEVPVYWIVDLQQETVDVMTEPERGAYAERRRYHRGETVPLPPPVPGTPVDVDAILGEETDPAESQHSDS